MRFVAALLVLWAMTLPVAAQDVTQVQFVKSSGRLAVEAVVRNRGTEEAAWDLRMTLQPDRGGRAVTVRKKGVRVRPGQSRTVRFATALIPQAEPQLNTCLARSGSGQPCVYAASVRLDPPSTPPVAAPPPPVPSPSPGLLVIGSKRFRNGRSNGELVATVTLHNDGGAPASGTVRLLFRDLRGGALDRSADVRNVPPGQKRDVIIRTGLYCPDRIDTSGGSVHVRNIKVVSPAQVEGSYDPVSGDAVYRYYPPGVQITEGFYSIEVRLEPSR